MKRTIGRTQLFVNPLCLGGNVFGWTIDEPTSFAVLDAFVAGGGDFIDTADVYSAWAPGNQGGESETILGNWLKARGRRDRVVIATKVGNKLPYGQGLRAAHIARAVEESLRRLQTDVIDLYQAHIDDAEAPLEEALRAFDDLIRAGKVRAIGASNYTAARLREALAVSATHGLPRYECLQPRYNAIDRDFEAELGPLCLTEEVGVIPYFALAAGFLTGKYQPGAALPDTARAAGVQRNYFNDRGFAMLARVEAAARERAVTPGQVAVAWLIAQPGITAPIASATSVAQVEQLLTAMRLTLPADLLAEHA
ncbi:MAG TPA: aldo/keto reductase [Anaerolineales bacterium]|nr:aldo/keto reductase [Anaerolineales bacterium]HRF46238.1 aldo/keto reductase [Anaerolineales bacterium]